MPIAVPPAIVLNWWISAHYWAPQFSPPPLLNATVSLVNWETRWTLVEIFHSPYIHDIVHIHAPTLQWMQCTIVMYLKLRCCCYLKLIVHNTTPQWQTSKKWQWRQQWRWRQVHGHMYTHSKLRVSYYRTNRNLE